MKHWRIPPWEQVKVTQQVEGIGSNRILEVAQLRKGVMDSLTGDSLTQKSCTFLTLLVYALVLIVTG